MKFQIGHKLANTHSLSYTKEYNCWRNIKSRCYNENNKRYDDYGGRGIKVCDRWLESVENYVEDMGFPPFKEAQVDRIDNDAGYSKENCRWATPQENSLNKRKK